MYKNKTLNSGNRSGKKREPVWQSGNWVHERNWIQWSDRFSFLNVSTVYGGQSVLYGICIIRTTRISSVCRESRRRWLTNLYSDKRYRGTLKDNCFGVLRICFFLIYYSYRVEDCVTDRVMKVMYKRFDF